MYIPYKLADGSVVLVEVTLETAEFILMNDREIANADRRERYHTPYHIDALEYEGEDYAVHETPEDILIRKEEKEHLDDMLSCLTDTQFQRLTMKAEGMTLRQIAEAEGTNVNAVRDSLLQVRKNLRNTGMNSETTLYKTACFSPYSERPLSNLQGRRKNQCMRDYRRT